MTEIYITFSVKSVVYIGRVHSSDLMELFYLGHVDPGESDLETALRETEEEAGLTKADLRILADFNKRIEVGIFVFLICKCGRTDFNGNFNVKSQHM